MFKSVIKRIMIKHCLLLMALIKGYTSGEVTDNTRLDLSQFSDSSTTMSIGQKQTIQLTAGFNPMFTTTGVHIEIVTTVLALGDIVPVHSMGLSLSVTNTKFVTDVSLTKSPDAEPTAGVAYNRKAVFDVGNVTCSEVNIENENTISIYFEVVCVSIGVGTVEANITYVFFDEVKYLNSPTITYTLTDAVTLSEGAVFVLGTLGNITLGTPAGVNLTMKIPNPKANVTILVNSNNKANSSGDVLVQSARVVEAGTAYAYSMELDNLQVLQYTQCPPMASLTWNIGYIVNKDSQTESPVADSYTVVVELTLHALDQLVVGNQVRVAVAVDLDSGIDTWLGHLDLNINNYSQPPIFTANHYAIGLQPGVDGTIDAGSIGIATVTMDIPSNSNLDYTVVLATSPTGAKSEALGILTVTQINSIDQTNDGRIQYKIPGDILEIVREDVSQLVNMTTLSFNVNINGLPVTCVETVVLEVVLLMLPTATMFETHTFSVGINELGPKNLTFTSGSTTVYPTEGYTFSAENMCPTDVSFESGSRLHIILTVNTTRDVIAGHMLIEAPIPVIADSPNFYLYLVRVKSTGKNVACLNVAEYGPELSDWVPGSGEQDRGWVKFPMMCNIGRQDDVAEDVAELSMAIEIKEIPEIYNTTQTFNISVTVGNHQPWIMKNEIIVAAPQDLGSIKQVLGIRVEEFQDSKWPGRYVLQWSLDNIIFHNADIEWLPDDGTADHMLAKPLPARYVRLKNGCRPKYTVIVNIESEVRFYGDEMKTVVLMEAIHLAIDNDTNTSIHLPTRLTTVTTQYFWLSVDLAAFGRSSQDVNFSVVVIGHGLSCDSSSDQVTKVTHPYSEGSGHFVGKRRLCPLQTEEEDHSGLKTCTYQCNCNDVITCKDFNLLMYYTGQIIPELYDLVELQVI